MADTGCKINCRYPVTRDGFHQYTGGSLMDRAERIVRTRKRTKDLPEAEKQVKIARRRKWKKIGLDALEGVAGVAVGVAAGAVSDKLQD